MSLQIFTDTSIKILERWIFPDIPNFLMDDIDTVRESWILSTDDAIKKLEDYYKSTITDILWSECDDLNLLNEYTIIRALWVKLTKEELIYCQGNDISDLNHPLSRYVLHKDFSLPQIDISSPYDENHKAEDMSTLEQKTLEKINNYQEADIDYDDIQDLLITWEGLRLWDNFRLNFQVTLSKMLQAENDSYTAEINALQGKVISVAGEKKSLRPIIQLKEQQISLVQSIISEKLVDKSSWELLHIIMDIMRSSEITNAQRSMLIKEGWLFHNLLIEETNNQRLDLNNLSSLEEIVQKYESTIPESTKLELITQIIKTVENYNESIRLEVSTRQYEHISDDEKLIRNEVSNLQQKKLWLTLKESYTNEALISSINSLYSELEDFYNNGYQYPNEEQYNTVNNLIQQFNTLGKHFWDLNYYEINLHYLQNLKSQLEQVFIYNELPNTIDILQLHNIVWNISDNATKVWIRSYIEKEAQLRVLGHLYSWEYDKASTYDEIFNVTPNVIQALEEFDNIIENIDFNSMNLLKIKELFKLDYSSLSVFPENTQAAFIYKYEQKLLNLLKKKLELFKIELTDQNLEVAQIISDIILRESSEEIFQDVYKLISDEYKCEAPNLITIEYLRSNTYKNFKNFSIKKQNKNFNKENYQKIFQYFFNSSENILMLSHLWIEWIVLSNNYSLIKNILSIDTHDKNISVFDMIIWLCEKIKKIWFNIKILLDLSISNINKINNFLKSFDLEEYKKKWVDKIILSSFEHDWKEPVIKI